MLVNNKKIKLPSALPRRLKWGVSGCGIYAEESFLPALQQVQRSKLVSVYSHDLKRAKEIASKFGAAHSYDDYDSFLASDIDSVYISSVNSDHYEQVIKAAKAKKNILCERPIAITSEQAEKMIAVCKENKVWLVINHQHRFHPHVHKAKELIEKQMVGKIVSISTTYHTDFPADDNFRMKKELSGGGVLRDLGAQMIDLLRYFGGDISESKAFLDNVVYKSDAEDFAAAVVKFNNSGYGSFSVSYDCKKASNRIEIIGHNGSVSIENFFGKKNSVSKLIIDIHGEARKVFRKRSNKLVLMLRSVQRTFIKNEVPEVSGEDGLANMRIIEEIEKQFTK